VKKSSPLPPFDLDRLSPLLSIAKTAQALNRSTKTIHRWIRDHRLPAINQNPGGKRAAWRVPLRHVLKLRRENSHEYQRPRRHLIRHAHHRTKKKH